MARPAACGFHVMEVWIENTGMVELLNAGLRLAAASATFVRVTQSPILAHEPAASRSSSRGSGEAAAWPLEGRAQHAAMPLVG